LHYFDAIARIIHEKIRCLYTGYVCQRQTDGFDVALGERLRRHARYNVSLNSNHFARSKYDINVLECAGMFEQKQITLSNISLTLTRFLYPKNILTYLL